MRTLKSGDVLQRLLLVNVGLFLLVRITFAISSLFNYPLFSFTEVSAWLAIPSNPSQLLLRPWSLFTYMFFHWEFLHLLFNMLWLYWMGAIILEYLGAKKLFGLYIMGGLFGALAYVVAFNTFPIFAQSVNFSFALGASASVLAITVAAATLLPDYPISLILIGNVALKWIAAISVLLDVINISGENAGGHIAHLGGALFGFIYIKSLQRGTNLTKWLEVLSDRLSGKRGKMTVAYKRKKSDEDFALHKKATQEQMDDILDKISKSGYGSLSQSEKDFLFRISKEDQK
ncbi:MAG TPA: rhomboid family intramembrane serine protease [Bacteroidia bacterium]|nr:rhomboid family intramembrane serine protease [Bacteroidota bacterium]MBP9789126.1 rhomboid family intramembrane serine protease [Bacteroidia bacterium]MBP9922441.1 rhomboid family intramembrane serine protease [Bacteroidia bacterium]HQV99003.1 rhomboid family intramembrane serine protease [Bacteroidia bacterium]HQW22665.1 rhomboid family intramembrane serine protease [Bacteroidia bacterium]